MESNTRGQKSFYQTRIDELFDYASRRKETMTEAAESFDRLQEKTYQHVTQPTLDMIKKIYNGAIVLWRDLPCESFFFVDDPYDDTCPVQLRPGAILAMGYRSMKK